MNTTTSPTRGLVGLYTDPTPIAHGYTVADASRIAWAACNWARQRGAQDLEDKRSAALCAIIAALHEADVDPGGHALMRCAEVAVEHALGRDWSNRGYNSNTYAEQKNFQRYWRQGAHTPMDDAIAERLATPQILAALSERQQQTLHALAVCNSDPKAAALMLGISPNGVAGNLRNARAAFLALWHEHETPASVNWRRGRKNTYSAEAAAARPEIARRAVRTREENKALAQKPGGGKTL